MSKYGEPWRRTEDDDVADRNGNEISLVEETKDRVISCVNALEGIENVEAVREVIEAAKAIDEHGWVVSISDGEALRKALAKLEEK